MRRISLGHVNIALFTLIAILGIVYSRDLAWGARALIAYQGGDFPPLQETVLLRDAAAILKDPQGDPAAARELLEASLAIDPNSGARFNLGLVLERQGDPDGALGIYREYRRIDPLHLPTRLRLDALLSAAGQAEERRTLLEEGIAVFDRAIRLHIPRPDPAFDARYNEKAVRIYQELQRGAGLLRQRYQQATGQPYPAGGAS